MAKVLAERGALDLDRPQGYLSLEEAATEAKYSEWHLRKLAQNGQIRKKYIDRELHLSAEDLWRHFSVPDGLIGYKDAVAKFKHSERHLIRLVSSGTVRSIRLPTGRYFFEADIRELTEVPEGFMSYEDAGKEFGYEPSYIPKLAQRKGFQRMQIGKRGFAQRADMERYAASLDGNSNTGNALGIIA